MFIKTPEDGYWFMKEGIRKIEEMYGGKYIGYWAIKNTRGDWNESPVDVFYQSNPDTRKGHTHYFGIFTRNGQVFITNAESAFSEPITGVLTEDGEVIVSRYRHDYVTKGSKMIDGGRDYVKSSAGGPFVNVVVNDGEFAFSLAEDIHNQGWENVNDDGQIEFNFGV